MRIQIGINQLALCALIALSGGNTAFAVDQKNGFSMKPYLQKCGGERYSNCDSKELNQETIFEDALAIAKSKGLMLMAVVGADWCPSCKHFTDMIEKDSKKDDLFDRVVLVELNGDLSSTEKLTKKLNLSYIGYPAAFIFSGDREFKKTFYPSVLSSVSQMIEKLELEKPVAQAASKPSYVGQVFTTTLELPIGLTNDYGKADFYPNPADEYEKFINQGIAALHVFHYVDAFRSFRMAAEKNQNRVMGYVGQILAIQQIDKSEAAQYFTDDAVSNLKRVRTDKNLSQREVAWLEMAIAMKFNTLAGYTQEEIKGTLSVARAFDMVIEKDGENLDGLSLLYWLNPSIGTSEEKQALYQQTLKKFPKNVGAHHYLLHLAEMDNDMRTADKHAVILKDLALGSAHAQHMYGHTLPQRGQWKLAVQYFEKADALHEAWGRKNGVHPNQDWHYSHNLDLLAASYLGSGDLVKAANTWAKANSIVNWIYVNMILGNNDVVLEKMDQLSAYGKGWPEYLAPLREELQMTPALVRERGIFSVIGNERGGAKFIAQLKTKYYMGEKLSQEFFNEVNSYFASEFKKGGFDGWSHAYLELLRVKRVARILGQTEFESEIQALEFAVQSGSLCGNGAQKSLIPCLE